MEVRLPCCRLHRPYQRRQAASPEACAASVKVKVCSRDGKRRRVTYLDNVIEQAHRARRRRWRAVQGLRSFHPAEGPLAGIEAMHLLRQGQVKRLDGRDAEGQAKFVKGLFGIVA